MTLKTNTNFKESISGNNVLLLTCTSPCPCPNLHLLEKFVNARPLIKF